jgi:flagellar basal body-associated protein FliL
VTEEPECLTIRGSAALASSRRSRNVLVMLTLVAFVAVAFAFSFWHMEAELSTSNVGSPDAITDQ